MSAKPKPWAESLLVAYVDGELEPAQAAAVAESIRDDPEAQAIVGVLRRSAAVLRGAFHQPLQEPAPERLLAALAAAPEAMAVGGKVMPLRSSRRGAEYRPLLAVLAASILALAIGFGAGYLAFGGGMAPLRPAAGPTDDPAAARFESALHQALESGRQGHALTYADDALGLQGAVTILGKASTSFGDDCREFRYEANAPSGREIGHGIACRAADGGWSAMTVPSPATSAPSAGE